MTTNSPSLPFIKFPHFLLTLDISLSAKLVYALLLDRAELSKANGWTDEQGRVYVIYPVKELASRMGLGTRAVDKILHELDSFGLIKRQKIGFAAASTIYINVPHTNFSSDITEQKCANDTNFSSDMTRTKVRTNQTNNKQTKRTKQKTDVFADFAGDNTELLETLKAFNEMRTRIGKPMTDRAKKMLCDKLDKKFQPCERIAILNQSIYHGWQDVYELKDENANTTQTAQPAGKELGWLA